MDFVEVGWYIDASDYLRVCDPASNPHYFQYAIVSGGIDCAHPSAAVSGTDTVLVKSPAHDTVWYYELNGATQGHFNTNVVSGQVFATSERHLSGESLYASFAGLKWAGASGSWNAWTELTKRIQPVTGDDPSDYSFCKTAGVTDAFTVKLVC